MATIKTLSVRNRSFHDPRGKKVLDSIERKIRKGYRILSWTPGRETSRYVFLVPEKSKV